MTSSPCHVIVLLLTGDACGAPFMAGTRLALAVAQQLAHQAKAPRLLIFSCSAAAPRASSDAAQGGMSGFGRVLRLECAALRAQSVDLSRGSSVAAMAALSDTSTEAEVVWTGTSRCVARLRACTARCECNVALTRSTNVITGGLGGLGQLFAPGAV